MAGLSAILVGVAAFGAAASWLAAAYFALKVVAHRGDVSRLELAGSFLTAMRKLPPEAAPHLARLWTAFAAFFAFVLVGVAAGLTASR